MKPTGKALLLAALQVVLAASLGGKLLLDRASRPRFWVKTLPVDPDAPIRGRYVSLRVELPMKGTVRVAAMPTGLFGEEDKAKGILRYQMIRLVPEAQVLNGELAPAPAGPDPGFHSATLRRKGDDPAMAPWVAQLDEPLAYFIPEHVPDPSRRGPGEELWVEVTLPRKGPPRPIRLGVKRDGVIVPI
ncbi:MAG: hypothetical protein HGA66_04435 [Holophaga sp.]|nr:hypothetical protein [Holophaga sp.]